MNSVAKPTTSYGFGMELIQCYTIAYECIRLSHIHWRLQTDLRVSPRTLQIEPSAALPASLAAAPGGPTSSSFWSAPCDLA